MRYALAFPTASTKSKSKTSSDRISPSTQRHGLVACLQLANNPRDCSAKLGSRGACTVIDEHLRQCCRRYRRGYLRSRGARGCPSTCTEGSGRGSTLLSTIVSTAALQLQGDEMGSNSTFACSASPYRRKQRALSITAFVSSPEAMGKQWSACELQTTVNWWQAVLKH